MQNVLVEIPPASGFYCTCFRFRDDYQVGSYAEEGEGGMSVEAKGAVAGGRSGLEYRFGNSLEYDVKVAATPGERRRAWDLVHRMCQEKGYCAPDKDGLWYGMYDVLPQTKTFLVTRGEADVATLTLVFDSEYALPADSLYREELGAMRSEGRHLCEIVALVSSEEESDACLEVLKHLFKLAYMMAFKLADASDFVVVVDSRHAHYYENTLLFRRVGGVKYCEDGRSTALLALDAATAPERMIARHGLEDGSLAHHFLAANSASEAIWFLSNSLAVTSGEERVKPVIRLEGRFDCPVNLSDSLPRGQYHVLMAHNRELRQRAWHLAYEVYRRMGYEPERDSQMRIILQDVLPETRTFMIEAFPRLDSALATLTLVPDSPLGIPMDANCNAELNGLRSTGRRICEVVKLAVNEDVAAKRGFDTTFIFPLFQLGWLQAVRLGATDLVISVVPRHARFYEDVLLFESIGAARSYGSVSGTTGVPLRLDLTTVEARYAAKYGFRSGVRNLHRYFFSDKRPEILRWLDSTRTKMSDEDIRYFFAEQSERLALATEAERAHLIQLYPGCDFESMLEHAAASCPGVHSCVAVA